MKVKNNSSGGASEDIMELVGKRVGSYSEGDTGDTIEMNLGCLKQISGEDKLSGRHLYTQSA